MEFNFAIQRILRGRITQVDMGPQMRHGGTTAQRDEIIDRLGAASAKAQKLAGSV